MAGVGREKRKDAANMSLGQITCLTGTGIDGYFDDIFISSDEGCKKPDVAFYKKLIDKHGLNISECVIICCY